MSTLLSELTALKTDEDKITGNKVANFAYDDYAYENDDANGVDTYNVNNHQNIPNATANILKVNSTILNKGWRAQASAITRMLMNHFLGRCSYNLNKINDYFSTLLAKLIAYIGQPDGLATLDSNGKVALLNNVANTGDSATPTENGTEKFTTGGAYNLVTAIDGKAPINHASSTTDYGTASVGNYGHVKRSLGGVVFSAKAVGETISIGNVDGRLQQSICFGMFIFDNNNNEPIIKRLQDTAGFSVSIVEIQNGEQPYIIRYTVTASGEISTGFSCDVMVSAKSTVIAMVHNGDARGLLARL